MSHFFLKRAALLGGDFERTGKPAGKRAIKKGIADEKHEDDRKKRERHGADEHFGFEASAKLLTAAFEPEAKDGAGEDKAENDQGGGDEGRDGVKSENNAPVFGFEGNIERAEGENSGEEKREDHAADDEPCTLTTGGGSHEAASTFGRNFWRAHSEQRGARERQKCLPVRTMSA